MYLLKSVLAAVKRDSDVTNLGTWHRRLGHLGDLILNKLVTSETVKGKDVTDTHLDGICEECILGKMDEKPFKTREEWDTQLFATLHADLMGPMNPEAHWSHAKFCLVINDDCSEFGFVFNLRHKDEVTKTIFDLDKAIETKFHKRVHTLRSNNGGKLINRKMQDYCQERYLNDSFSCLQSRA